MRHSRRIAPALLALLLLLAPLSGGGQAAALPADVAGHWAEPDIQYLADRGVIQWVRAADGSEAFWPRQNITRIDFATWLVRALGLAPIDEVTFTDLAGDALESARPPMSSPWSTRR